MDPYASGISHLPHLTKLLKCLNLYFFFVCVCVWSSEIERPENKGLSAALSMVEEAKKEIDSYSKGGPISYSDLIQLAGLVFVRSSQHIHNNFPPNV